MEGMKIRKRIGSHRKWNVIATSTFSGDGLVSALSWFYIVFKTRHREEQEAKQPGNNCSPDG